MQLKRFFLFCIVCTTLLFFCHSSYGAILKGVIGVHSTYSDGTNTVAELCTKAKQLGYNYLIFTETYEDMDSTKWSQLVSECSAQTGSGFYAVAGLDVPSLYSGKVIRALAFNPKSFPTATGLIDLLFTYGQDSFTPTVTTPNKNGISIWRQAFWRSIEVFSYRDGALYDDASDLYRELVTNKLYFFPVSGHRVYSVTDLEGLDNDYKTYFKDSVLSVNCFLSNGPIINDFYIDSPGTWWGFGDVDKYTIHFNVSSADNITTINMYRDNKLFRTYHPNSTSFSDTFYWYPVEGTRFYFTVEDSSGKKAYSNYLYIQSYPFYNVMCMDNQNNIPCRFLNPIGIDDIVNFGAAHFYSHNVRLFCNRPTGELVPPGQETGLAGAIYSFAAYHKLGNMTDWTAYDKIAFYFKSDHIGIIGSPRWMNNGVWNPFLALAVTTTDTNWHYYELDLSSTARDNVSDFLFYIPSTGYDFKVWIDDLKLINSSTGEVRVLDNFNNGVDLWLTGAPDNYIWPSSDAQEGTQSVLIDVQRTDAIASNSISFLGLGNFPVHKMLMPLSGKECLSWKYYGEDDDVIQNATYYLFLPPLYKYNAMLLNVKTEFKHQPNLDYVVEPGQFGMGLSEAGVQTSLGDWPNFAYLNTSGSLVTGTFASTSPQAVQIQNRGFVASYPNAYGSYAYMPIDDRPYAFSGSNGNLRIGYVNKPTEYITDNVLENDFLFLLDAGSGYFNQPDDFATFRDVYGFDGSTAYDKTVTVGSVVGDIYALRLAASNYETRGTITSADLPNELPVIVEGLNGNWDAVAYNKTTGEFKRIPVMDGKGYFVQDISSGADFIYANLIRCDNPDLVINTVANSASELFVEVHNPTGSIVSTHLATPPSINNGIVISRDVTVDAYSTTSFTVDTATFNTLILTGPIEGEALDTGVATFAYSANKPIQEYYYRLIGYEGAYTSTTSTTKTYTDLPSGSYIFSVYARAADGTLETTPDERSFTVNIFDTVIVSGPAEGEVLNTSSVTFTYSANQSAQEYYYRLIGYESSYTSTTSTTKEYTDLPNGSYTFSVYARRLSDGLLDDTPAQRSFSVDVSVGLDTTITSGPTSPWPDTSVTFQFEANMPVKFFYYRLSPVDSRFQKTRSSSTTYTGLANGDYEFIVYAQSIDGTKDTTPASWPFTVAAESPPVPELDTTIISGPDPVVTDGKATFVYEANMPVKFYYCKLDGLESSYSKTKFTTKSYKRLPGGDYLFNVYAEDASGNIDTTPAQWAFSVAQGGGVDKPGKNDLESTTSGVDVFNISLYPNESANNKKVKLFKDVPFTLEQDSPVYLEVVATCAAGENDDDIVVVLRGADGTSTVMTFNGDDIAGAVCAKLARANLTAGDYTLEIYAEGTPTLNTVKISTAPLADLLDVQLNEVPASAELGLFKEFLFDGAVDLTLEIVAKADAGDDVVVYLDGVSYGMDTPESIDGDAAKGEAQVLNIPVSALAEGSHTVTLVTQGVPTIIAVRVLTSGE